MSNLEKEKRKNNDMKAEVSKKEIEKLELKKELKKKQKALDTEEAELVNARDEISKFRDMQISQLDQVAGLQAKINEQATRIRNLEEENEDIKGRSGATKTPDKKRKQPDSRGSSTDRDMYYSTPRSENSIVHRREKPNQSGKVTGQKNPSQSG